MSMTERNILNAMFYEYQTHRCLLRSYRLHAGLDPAGPLFETREWTVGLNPSSADLVDVIHTNGKAITGTHMGTMKILGHVDFYPNGGGRQPSCVLDPIKTIDDEYHSIRRGLLGMKLSGNLL